MSDTIRRVGNAIVRHDNKPVKFTGCGLDWACRNNVSNYPNEPLGGCEPSLPDEPWTGTRHETLEECKEACLWYGNVCDEFAGCTTPLWSDTGNPPPFSCTPGAACVIVASCDDCVPSYTCFSDVGCVFSGFRHRNGLDLFPNDPFSFFSEPTCNGQCAENEFP
jgi:hypothetical protein